MTDTINITMKILISSLLIFISSHSIKGQVPAIPVPYTTTTRSIDNKGSITRLTFTHTTIGYIFASAHIGYQGTAPYALNSTVTRTSTGRYTIDFTVAHPSGNNYPITLGVQEDSGNRDGRIIQVVAGTQNASGFDIMILVGDNSTDADTLVDEDWYFSVPATMSVITNVVVN